MVKHTNNVQINFKDKTYIPINSECSISMKNGSHCRAEIYAVNNLGFKKAYGILATNLHLYFKEFDKVSDEDFEEALTDGDNPSIYNLSECGNLEPDGFDEFGFPSKVLAMI